MEKDRTPLEVPELSLTTGTLRLSLGSIQVESKRPPKPPWYKRLKGRCKQALAFVGGWLIDKVTSWGLDGLWEAVLGALRPIFGRRRQPEQA